MEKIPTLEELNPGKERETSLEDLIKISGANKEQYQKFIDYKNKTNSLNKREAAYANDVIRITTNNVIEVNSLRERNCEELWAYNGSRSLQRLIKTDCDTSLLQYDKKTDTVKIRVVKEGEYINITDPTGIYPVTTKQFQEKFKLCDEKTIENCNTNLLKEAEKIEKILQKEKIMIKTNKKQKEQNEMKEKEAMEITPIDTSIKEKEVNKKELPASIKTPKEIYQPVYNLIYQVVKAESPEEKERLRQILYETSKRVAEELKAYDLSFGLNDIQRELDPKVYEQIRMNTAKELNAALEKGDLAKADLIDLTPEQREAALNCKNLDKAYNVPVGMMKEWYDRNGQEYPEKLKNILNDIQNGKIKPPQDAVKDAPVTKSAYAEFRKVEKEINDLRENEMDPDALARIEVTMFKANNKVMDTYISWEKEKELENTQDLSHDEKEHDGPSIGE